MNFFSSATAPSTNQQQVVPKKFSDEEKKQFFAPLLTLVPGNYQASEVIKTHKYSKKGGKKGNRQRVLHFPTPAQAAGLNKVYTMVKTYDLTAISSTIGIPTQGAYSFDYNSINDSGSLTGVFDQYRIRMLEVSFLPVITQNLVGQIVPTFYSTVDLDDSTSISAAQILDYAGALETLATIKHTHTWVPHCAVAAYSGAFTSFMNVAAPWIDVASPAVQHYGIKYAFSGTGTNFAVVYDVRVRMLLDMRCTR